MSKPSHEDKSDSSSNKSTGRAKLTDQLIDQGLLTKNMMDELRSEWEDRNKDANRKTRRSKNRKGLK